PDAEAPARDERRLADARVVDPGPVRRSEVDDDQAAEDARVFLADVGIGDDGVAVLRASDHGDVARHLHVARRLTRSLESQVQHGSSSPAPARWRTDDRA